MLRARTGDNRGRCSRLLRRMALLCECASDAESSVTSEHLLIGCSEIPNSYRMDDDEYNVIGTSNFFNDEERLSYGEEDGGRFESPLCMSNEFNDVGRRSSKRPLSVENCDAIDWHMKVPCSLDEANQLREREQLNEDILNRLAERILQARKRKRLMKNVGEEHHDEVDVEMNSTEGAVLQYPPSDGSPWIGVSAPNFGQRYYIRLRTESSNERKQRISAIGWGGHLNSRPIHEILETAHEELRRQQENQEMEVDTATSDSMASSAHTQLWVEKYAPRSFVDLISDDRVNRFLLKWLKLWDECVFKRSIPDSMLKGDEDRDDIITLDNGKPRRPSQKVVLIAGPAGFGKTTLASVAARHCGYRVVEMNASDDRNVSDFEREIEGAIRSVRTLDMDGRPNCLLVDEIDGAPADAIRYLCKTLALKGRKAIRRPVICICNNLYVPSLRELRSIALVLQMPHSEQHRLERRLLQIARCEHIRIETSAVAEIINICAQDLRSSINALQFIAVESSSGVIDHNVVHSYGEHETQLLKCGGEKSLFDAWRAVLEVGRHVDGHGRVLDVSTRTCRVQALCQRFASESDRFHSGLFANYLSTSCGSHNISSISAAACTFCDYDHLNYAVGHSQNYELMKYMFASSVRMHLLVASTQRLQLIFPVADQDAWQKRRQSMETVLTVRAGSTQRNIPQQTLILDLLPMIILIVQPPLKPMNAQLYSARELELVRSAVAIMRSYSLTFTATYQDGVSSFIFCPPVDVLVLFPIEESDRRRVNFLSNAARQMIAHQIEIERLRGDGAQWEKENSAVNKSASLRSIVNSHTIDTSGVRELSGRNMNKTGVVADLGIVYKYNQGFSNAVRRDIRMRSLIF
uniref:Chromosome transmission fidelity protein 18-like protein n=3 Tax=Parascaris univalens TaxID=6257 RepID=A0A915BIB3_PARUN